MTPPDCAVVLCSYNGERHLPAQLESLRAQTVQPACYVLSDDASTDAGWDLLQAFAEDRRRAGCEVVLHRNACNLGYVRHFEQALQRADAEVLFPCDQDDAWHPRKIEVMRESFVMHPGLLLLHADARLVDGEGRALGRRLFEVLELRPGELAAMHRGDGFDVLLRRNIVTGAAMAFRRRLLPLAIPFTEDWSHDEWLAIVAAMHGEVDTLEEALVDYRQHGGNQIGVRGKTLGQQAGLGVGRHRFLARAVRRGEALSQAAQAMNGLPEARMAAIDSRLAHARLRAGLPSGFLARARQVAGEWRSGRYRRYASGWRSALADLSGID